MIAIIERNGSVVETYDLPSYFLKQSVLFVLGGITTELTSATIAELLFLYSKGKKKVTIYLNSPGGSVTDGFSLYDTIQYLISKGMIVEIICMGMAASMGSFLLLSGSKGYRKALSNSLIMIHQPAVTLNALLRENDLTIQADLVRQLREKLELIMSKHTGQSIEKIHKDSNLDFYMTSQEAKEYGIIDEII